MDTDVFVEVLTVPALLDGFHHDILGRHEGKLLEEVLLDHLRVDDEAGDDIDVELQDGVGRKERFRDGDPLVGGIVECSLEPLGGRGERRVQGIGGHIAGQRADAFGTHRVTLVSHGRGADLCLLERLFDLFHVLQEAQVVREFRRGLRDAGEDADHLVVELSGVSLTGDRIAGCEAHLVSDLLVELTDLLLIAFKEFHEGSLSTGGALGAEESHGLEAVFHFVVVEEDVLEPEGGALADGGRLGGLVMGEAQRRKVLVFNRELRQLVEEVHEFLFDESQAFGHRDDVGVVADVAGRGAEVDDALRVRALDAVGIDVRHDVVTAFLLFFDGDFIVDVVGVRFQFVDLLLRDGQAQFVLGLGQSDPQFSPGLELEVRREDVLHLFRRVPGVERSFVSVLLHNARSFRIVLWRFNANSIHDFA